MENSTKALLIAATVLIVIIIISLSILLLRGVEDSIKQTNNVGENIKESIGNSIGIIQGKKYATKDEVLQIMVKIAFQGYYIDSNSYGVLNNSNTKIRDKIELNTYVYKFNANNMQQEFITAFQKFGEIPAFNVTNPKPYYDYYINNIGKTLINENKVIMEKNPLNFDSIKSKLWNVYKDNDPEATKEKFQQLNKECATALEYDNEEYVKGIYFVYCVNF